MKRLTVALATVALLAMPPLASAHARMLFSTPADGEVVATAPSAVTVRFDDVVVVGPGNAAVDARGRSVLAGAPRARGHVLTLPLRPLAHGGYSVRWSVVSDDGHTVAGVISFSVGTSGPHASLSAGGGGPPADDVVYRFFLLGGILVAGGAAVFGTAVARSRRVAWLAAAAFAVAGAGAVLEVSRLPGGTRFGDAMIVVAASSAVGVALAAATAVTALAPVLLAVPAAVDLVAMSVSGHASDAGVSRMQAGVDVVHFAAAAVWLGGLASLAVAAPRDGGLTARRFSRLALAAVLVVGASGVVRAYGELSSVGQLTSTSYGEALLAKSALLACLVVLGYRARSRLLPRAAALRRSVLVELALAALLVVAVAVLTAVAPGRVASASGPARVTAPGPPPAPPPDALTLARPLGSNGIAVAVSPRGGAMAVRVTVLGPQGDGVDRLAVRVAGRPTTACGHGCYAATVPGTRGLRVGVGGRSITFALPRAPFAGGRALLRTVGARVLRARTVAFDERLSSGPGQVVTSHWRLAAPASLAFTASDGSSGVIVGGRRWDRQPGGKWLESPQSPHVPQPQLPWPGALQNVVDLGPSRVAGREVRLLSFVDPATPAWYSVAVDTRTRAPVRVEMVAPAHFMRDDYRGLDLPFRIRPPR